MDCIGDLEPIKQALVDAILECCDSVLLDLVYKIIISSGA